jgi:hypothetical protein
MAHQKGKKTAADNARGILAAIREEPEISPRRCACEECSMLARKTKDAITKAVQEALKRHYSNEDVRDTVTKAVRETLKQHYGDKAAQEVLRLYDVETVIDNCYTGE